MAKLNIVVVSAETQYKVTIKNKISDPEIAIVGYADYTKESRLKIEGYTPDVVVCVASSPIESDIFKFIEGMHFQKTGCSAVIVTDDVNVNVVIRQLELVFVRLLILTQHQIHSVRF